ncbi:MAG: DUF1217 domain-containing protein [Pseudomonadota bacterium]
MTFAPILPLGGVAGFRLLEATETAQRATFERQPIIARDVTYFLEKISEVRTADDLVNDRRLLRVALGAFGLDEEIDKKAFIKKIVAEGTESDEAFANRFVDPRYGRFADAFGFGNIGGARTGLTGFAQSITSAYTERQFEIAVGEGDETMRLALNFRREIREYAAASDPSGTAWFSVMGDVPVRRVFEGAFGLPESFGQLDIDRQRDELRSFNNRTFGSESLDIFSDETKVDEVIGRFLARAAAEAGPSAGTPGFTALSLLNGSGGIGSAGLANILLSSARLG